MMKADEKRIQTGEGFEICDSDGSSASQNILQEYPTDRRFTWNNRTTGQMRILPSCQRGVYPPGGRTGGFGLSTL